LFPLFAVRRRKSACTKEVQRMAKIALFGAAGAIGHSLADTLRQRGENYRVVGRDRARLEKAFGSDPKAKIVTWDPDDPASIREAAREVDTLIYLVGVPYNHFELHPQVMQKTLDGAIAEGVRRILLIGTVYPYGTPVSTPMSEKHPRGGGASAAGFLWPGSRGESFGRYLQSSRRGKDGEHGGADRYAA
jgi:nucleoside-diphosphate-sugar epimerase